MISVKKMIRTLITLLFTSLFLSIKTIAIVPNPNAFIIEVNVDSLEGFSFTIPTNKTGLYDYNYSVDCNNDGNYNIQNVTGDYTCNYATPAHPEDTEIISIMGTFPHFQFNNTGDKEKLVGVVQWGTQQWKDMSGMFYGASNLVYLDTTPPDLSNVANLSNMFAGATSFNQDIGDWDVSNVGIMDGIFAGATSFNQDIGDWDVSNLLYMSFLFYNATSFNQDIGDWDVSGVTVMNYLFYGASSFNQDIGDWDISSINSPANFSYMFMNAHLSISNYDNLLLSWYTLNPINGVNFNAGTSNYCRGTGAHDDLEIRDLWSFTDGIEDCNFHITSPFTMSVGDGESVVGTVTSTYGADDTWFQITGGADANKFNINDEGELTFISSPDVNNPTDRNKDNIYRVQVYAYDDMGVAEDYQTIRVKVESNSSNIVPIITYLLF